MTDEVRPKLDDYGTQEMVIPEWRLIQKIGGDWAKAQGANPGQFHNAITDDISHELNIVVVDILEGRTKWGEEIGRVGPECYSLDAKSGQGADGADCQQCPDRLDTPWLVSAAERRTRCCLNFTVLGIDVDHDNLPIIVRAHGVSVKPVRELITQLRLNKGLKRQYYRAVVNIKSEEVKTAFGSVFAIHPKIIRLVTDESLVQTLRLQSQELLGAPLALPEGRSEDEVEVELQPGPDYRPVVADKRGEFEKEGRDPIKEAKELSKPREGAQHVELPNADLWDNI